MELNQTNWPFLPNMFRFPNYSRKLLWPFMRSEQEFVTDCLDDEEFIRLLNSGGADYESEDED